MPKILIVEKSGDIKCHTIKTFCEEDLYKKCNFKSGDDFIVHASWNFAADTIILYGKTVGRATYENKYDFPPPADNKLFFGSCILVRRNSSGQVVDLTPEFWAEKYNILFGGFDDLDSGSTDESDDDDDEALAAPRTKSGYVKDGFVVDDDDDDADEDYEPPKPRRSSSRAAAVAPAPPTKTAAQIAAEVQQAMENMTISTPTPTPAPKAQPKRPPRAPKKVAPESAPPVAPIPFPSLDDLDASAQQKSIYEESPELSEEEF
jgi:hypothetical protein